MKSTSVIAAVCSMMLTLCLVRPVASFATSHDVLKAAGCKTEYFLLYDLAEAYKNETGNKIQLGKTGNKKAVDLLLEKKIDFAFTCKTINQLSKKLKLDENEVSTWKSIPVARDPIVIVSNPQNGVTDISSAQLTDIFKGKVKNWKEIGGNDLPIHTSYLNPELESGVVLLFKEFTVGDESLDENARISDGPSMSGNYVSITPGGITFMAFNSYREKYGDILAIDGIHPTRENILNGKYSLSALYYLTVNGVIGEDVTRFIEFVESKNGRKVIEMNFIPFAE